MCVSHDSLLWVLYPPAALKLAAFKKISWIFQIYGEQILLQLKQTLGRVIFQSSFHQLPPGHKDIH